MGGFCLPVGKATRDLVIDSLKGIYTGHRFVEHRFKIEKSSMGKHL